MQSTDNVLESRPTLVAESDRGIPPQKVPTGTSGDDDGQGHPADDDPDLGSGG
jgi:hypothetical protein